MSWAAVARAGAAAAARAEPVEDAGERKRVVVVDANAIIAGMRVEHLGERVVTVSEVCAAPRGYGPTATRMRRWALLRDDDVIPCTSKNALLEETRLSVRGCPQVLNEVRDRHSRAFLDTLPFGIEVAEPDDASMTAVRKFATATGDIYSLSGPDLRLIALCYMLEAEAHGSGERQLALRQHPLSGLRYRACIQRAASVVSSHH